jgi:hypothetical protein
MIDNLFWRTHTMPKRFILFLLLLLFVSTPAGARISLVYNSYDVDHFSIRIPDGWKVNVGIEPDSSTRTDQGWILPRIVTAMPDEAIPLWFGIWVPPDVATIDDAKPYMDSLAPELLTDVEVRKKMPGQINNRASLHVSGTGYKGDELMDFAAVFVQLSPQTLVIAIYIGPHEATIRYGEDLKEMINSLEPAGTAKEEQP